MLAAAIAPLRRDEPGPLLVVPIPLHGQRQKRRGFNQAEEIARQAVKTLRVAEPGWKLQLASHALLRLRNTPEQAGQTARQRRINLRGAFQASSPSALEGRPILLIDDVMTTGATVRAAAAALHRAGAGAVWVATVARAMRIVPVQRGSDLPEDDPLPASTADRSFSAQTAIRLDASHGSLQGHNSF
jgi:ComF family protein